jgi:hypothetical protein
MEHLAKPRALPLSLTLGFAIAFAVSGARQVGPALRAGAIHPPSELHSCDLYLELVAHRPQLAARLSAALRALPSDKPIAIVLRDQDPESAFLGMLSAYLAWPHTIHIFRVEEVSPAVSPRDYVAIIYCNLPQENAPSPEIVLSQNLRVALSSAR